MATDVSVAELFFLGDVRGLVVRLILGCRLRHDWIKADAVDGLTLKLHPDRFDLGLVSRPVVGIAKGVFDRLPVGAIEHHGADVAFKVQNVFFLRVFSFTDLFPLDVRDHRDAGLVLYVGTFEVLAWESFICAHFEISYESMDMLRFVFVFSLITVLLGAPPLGTCVLCARRSPRAPLSVLRRARSIARLVWTASRDAGCSR